MNALRLSWSEVRRLTASRGALAAVFALLLIPTLYGAAYLYANHDPYSHLDRIPAALVVEDTGATTSHGNELKAGKELADRLVSDAAFDWSLADASTAEQGVREGQYDFSVTIPADFSEALATAGTTDARQATLQLTTNDSTNYLSRTIATQATERIRAALAKQVGQEAAGQFLLGFADVSESLGEAADGAAKLADGAQSASSGASRVTSGAGKLADGTNALASGAGRLAEGAGSAASGASTLADATGQLASGLATLADSTADLPAQTSELAAGAARAATAADALKSGSSTLASGAHDAADGAASLATGTEQLVTGSTQVTQGLAALQASMQAQLTAAGLPDGTVEAVVGQIAALHTGSQSVTSGLSDLGDGAEALSAGTAELASGADALAAGSSSLATGAQDLADGTSALASGASQLAAGISTADSAAGGISTGADRLADGTASLASGATDVASGARTVDGGADKLATGTSKLTSGLSTLASGTQTLEQGLADGAAAVPVVPEADRDDTAATLADPVAVESTAQAKAPSYGAGLAPFFLSLALWIGAYVLFLLVRPLSKRALAADQKPWRIAIGGWLTPAVLGVLQAIAVALVVSLWVGITPAQPVAAVLFMVLASVTFVAILQALVAWFGPIGQYLGLILMILQLVSGGGTFPWQTLPEPLWPLHAVLPMPHAIDGLRQLFYGGDPHAALVQAAVLAAYLVGALLITTLAARRQRTWTAVRLAPSVTL